MKNAFEYLSGEFNFPKKAAIDFGRIADAIHSGINGHGNVAEKDIPEWFSAEKLKIEYSQIDHSYSDGILRIYSDEYDDMDICATILSSIMEHYNIRDVITFSSIDSDGGEAVAVGPGYFRIRNLAWLERYMKEEGLRELGFDQEETCISPLYQ